MSVLLLEDDLELGAALHKALERAGHTTQWVRLAHTARDALADGSFCLAILDITLPDGSGLDVLAWLRDRQLGVPVMMLTARAAVADRVYALDHGADDYLPKPFAFDELLSRARALIRRGAGFASNRQQLGPLSLDLDQRRTWCEGRDVGLTPSEFDLLATLVGRAGRVLTRAQLERAMAVHGLVGSNAIEVHMHNIRRKLGLPLIRTVRGVGYVLDLPDDHGT